MEILELLGVFANLTGIGETELSDKLKTNSEGEKLDEANVKQVLNEAFGAKFKSISEQQHARGSKEKGKFFESEIKKHTGLDSDKIGIDLIKQIPIKIENAGGEGLTIDNVAENEIVKNFVKEKVQNAVQLSTTELSNKVEVLTGKLKAQEQKENKNIILNSALSVLDKHKAILGKDGNKDSKRVKTIEILLSQQAYKIENNVPIPVDSEGNQLLHPTTYNPISFEEQVKELNPFGFHEIDPNTSSPSPKTQQLNSSAGATKSKFENREQYLAYQNNPSVSYEDKKAATADWKASQTKE